MIEDLTGRRFGRLVVTARAPNEWHRPVWTCRCDCGELVGKRASDLLSGHTRSCGCLRRENTGKVGKANAGRDSNIASGVSRTARVQRVLASIFRPPPDTIHVDRPGARVVRGGRY